jgi:hypothetical protein
MNRGMEPDRMQRANQAPPATRRDHSSQPEVDLDRLVWDPEYRNAMRPLIKPGG